MKDEKKEKRCDRNAGNVVGGGNGNGDDDDHMKTVMVCDAEQASCRHFHLHISLPHVKSDLLTAGEPIICESNVLIDLAQSAHTSKLNHSRCQREVKEERP